jgi:hypothetical protein
MSKTPARRHNSVKVNSDHFLGHDERVLVSRLCHQHVAGAKLVSDIFADGNTFTLSNDPELIAIMKVSLHRIARP